MADVTTSLQKGEVNHKLIHNDYACREIGLIKCSLVAIREGEALSVVVPKVWLLSWADAQSARVDKRGGKNER